MTEPIIKPDSTLAKARAGMGYEEGDDKDLLPEEEQAQQIEDKKPESKPKEEVKEEAEEAESETETEKKDEGEKKEEGEKSSSKSDAKEIRPLKAVFTQLKQIAERLDKIEKTPQTKETKEVAQLTEDALKKFAEEVGASPEAIEKLYSTFQTKFLADMEKQGLLKNNLPADVQEKLKLLDNLIEKNKVDAVKEREQSEVAHFNKEWDSLAPAIKKQFPFAGADEYAEAKKLMDSLSHDSKEGGVIIDEKNKILKPYSLDYILYKNKDKFSAILKVASNKKSGETSSKEIIDVNDDEDVDLDPENMNPAKFKRHEAKKLKNFQTEKPQVFEG